MKKKDEKMRFLKNNYTWLVSSGIVFVFMLIFMLVFKVSPFGTRTFANADCFHQMYPMLVFLQRALKTGDSMLYQWNSGIGGDFLPTYFYYIASPIYLLVGLINKEDIMSFVSITIAFKYVLSAGTFGFFLSRRNGKPENNLFYVALSCAYALSNYMCGYYYEIMWIDSLVVFPLIILGYKWLKQNNSPFLYVLSLSYSLYCNYYISYIVCLFLVINFLLDDHKDIKSFWNEGVKFALYSILSAGMAGISLVVSYIGLTKTVSHTEGFISHSWYGSIFEVLRQLYILSNPVLTSIKENDANIYCGTFSILMVFLYILNNKIKMIDKIKKSCLVVFLFFSMNESLLNYIWHGFHKQHGVPNRFAFLLVFIILIISADLYDAREGLSIKRICCSTVLSLLFPLIIYFFVDYNSIITSHQVLYVSTFLTILYSLFILLFKINKTIIKNVSMRLLSFFMIIEVLFNSLIVLKSKMINPIAEYAILQVVDEVFNHINNEDDEIFYRSDIAGSEIDNENMYHNMKGISIFNSTANMDYIVFSQYMGEPTGKNRLVYYQSKDFMDDLMGTKYIYAFEGNKDYDYDPAYEKIYSSNGINVYKNHNALSLAYGVDKNIKSYKYVEQDKLNENINLYTKSISGIDEIIKPYKCDYGINSERCEIGLGDTDYLSIQYEETVGNKLISVGFDIDNEDNYYVDIRGTNEEMVSLIINGEIYKKSIWLKNCLNSLGRLHKGDKITIDISDNDGNAYYNNKSIAELKYFVYSLDLENVQKMIDKLSQNQMVIKEFSNTKITGNIKLDSDQVLFTSIPYDNGWHIYDNGKEVNKLELADTFLGADLGAGEHNLTFMFIPDGLYIGIIISIISWIVFIIVCIIYIKNIKNKKEESLDEIENLELAD